MSPDPSPLHWVDDSAYWSANRAQHAIVGDYELIAYDIPPTGDAAAKIGWEIYTGPNQSQLLRTQEATDFNAAKAAAEQAGRVLQNDL